MKFINCCLIALCVLSIFSCSTLKNKKGIITSTTNESKIKYSIKSRKKSIDNVTETKILAEGWFNNESFCVFHRNLEISCDSLLTDDALGFSKEIALPKNMNDEISIKIKDYELIMVPINKRYKFVRVNYNNDLVEIILTNEMPKYW